MDDRTPSDGPAAPEPALAPHARAREAKAQPTFEQMEIRLRMVNQLLLQGGVWKTRHVLMHDPATLRQLGIVPPTPAGFSKSDANKLIRKVKERRIAERLAGGRDHDLEQQRGRLEEIAGDLSHPGAAVTAIRTLLELDGFIGKLQVHVDNSTNQHVHLSTPPPAVATMRELLEDLDSVATDELKVIRGLAQRALAKSGSSSTP